MAPLNLIKDDGDEQFGEDAVAAGDLSGAYGNLICDDFVCRKRNSASHLKLSLTNDVSKIHKNDTVSENDAEKFDENDNCEKCIKEKAADFTIYHKNKEHALVKRASIPDVLFDLSPKWFKKFLKEPEHLMTDSKAFSSEIHRNADSLFSTTSGFNNYRGLLNLCIILLALSNARLFLENIIKYGILIDPVHWVRLFMSQPYSIANIGLMLGVNVFVLVMYATEKAMYKSLFSETVALVVQTITLVLLLTFPAAVILSLEPNPMMSTIILGMYTAAFLKLVSYAAVNKWCRQSPSPRRHRMRRVKSVSVSEGSMAMANGKEDTMLIQYPENLNMSDLYYFMFAPTLCYELNFPRSLRIRKRFLLKRIIEMLFIIQLIGACIQQWVLPLVHNSMKPLAEMDFARSTERLLKLSIPNHFIWLMFFYWFFHSTLNVIAELLKFGDREFYKDWWNSDTVSQFWSSWNIPVHRWASRHLYKPLVKRGYSKLNGSVAVFCLSAFFHEYLVSIPLHMFKLWAFMGMLGQVPLALVQTKYIHGKYGNMVVWLSLILGQPVAILAYYHDFYINAYSASLAGNTTITT